MDVVFKKRVTTGSSLNAVLIAKKGDWTDDKVTWDVPVREVALTNAELLALKHSHRAGSVNIARATKVKSLMLVGYSPLQIFQQLRTLGRGYSLSSIKHDHAALSK